VQLQFSIKITGATGAFTDNATLTVPGYGQTASGNLNSGPLPDSNYIYNLWTTGAWTVPAHTILTMVHTTFGGATETFAFDCTTGGGASSSASTADCPGFGDGRINRCDAGQTVAIYCMSDGAIMVLNINTGKGSLAFIATRADIDAGSAKPATNTVIKSGNGATLYRLAGGELQVNRPEPETGKMYAYRFVACP
jgi:hypothetical protein